MIGGIDTHLTPNLGGTAIEVAVRVIRQRWPQATFENGLTGARYRHFGEIPLNDIEELFVYRDEAAADVWDEDGAVPSVFNTMIHLLSDEDTLTIVVDEKDAAMTELIAAIEFGLHAENPSAPATRQH